jgi:transcriptional regulator with XRE-family HTH domain
MDVRQFIGKNVERHRKAVLTKSGVPMTQIALVDALDMDRAYVSAIERGLRNPTVVTLFRIPQVIGVPLAVLFEVPDGSEGPTEAPKDREFRTKKPE